ncbi:MAG: hypothetical protein H0U92_15310 [Actinobacteria bacterium]|nr:hypothetical protein [Actinomycetota bacterium]
MTALLLLTTFGLGLRHGVDWDHLAAITDITGSEFERRRSAMLAVLYALGHGAAVLALGAIAIVAGEHLPTWIDPVMERLVGVTLLVLAVFLVRSLRRGDVAPVSRGVLLFRALGRLRARVRNTRRAIVDHQHSHGHGGAHAHGHASDAAIAEARELEAAAVITAHKHRHVHAVDVSRYTVGGAIAVGVLHGVGAETGTQAVVLVSATHVASTPAALAVLGAFVLGIVATTALLAVGAAFGWTSVSRRSRAYVALTAVTAVVSVCVGLAFISGHSGSLPSLLA